MSAEPQNDAVVYDTAFFFFVKFFYVCVGFWLNPSANF